MDTKNIVNTFLGKTLEYLNSTEAFLQKNVPAYVEELLQFEFYSAIFWALFFPLLALIFGLVAKRVLTVIKGKSGDERDVLEGIGATSLGICVLSILISLFVTPCNLQDVVKIKVAPRVYLVEKISSQLKGQ